VKNVSVRIAQAGNKKIAKTNLTQRVGTINESGVRTVLVACPTFRTVFTRRIGLRLPRLVVDLSLVAGKVIRRLREWGDHSKRIDWPPIKVDRAVPGSMSKISAPPARI
jgi:hypothetical protein